MKGIIESDYRDLQKENMIQYSEMVILGRAIPDVYDGLKVVNRRILWSVFNGSYSSNGNFKKSAAIVGEVLRDTHPHGDISVYDALAKMVSDHNRNQPLMDGHGGFENKLGDPTSAMRYTKIKAKKFTEEILLDNLNNNAVPLKPNFDREGWEPEYLPAKIPLILVNGSDGIASGGFSSSIPQHTIDSVIDSTIEVIKNPKIGIEELMKKAKLYPSFSHGGHVDLNDIYKKYSTGIGTIGIKANIIRDTESSKDYNYLIVDEIPFDTTVIAIERALKTNNNYKKIIGFINYENKSVQTDLKLVFTFDKAVNIEAAEHQLLKFTPLKSSVPLQFNLIKEDRLVEYNNIIDIIHDWISFRKRTIVRFKTDLLNKIHSRLQILKAYIRIIEDPELLNDIIEVMKKDLNNDEIISELGEFNFNEYVANYIVRNMKLYSVRPSERKRYEEELASKEKEYNDILSLLTNDENLNLYIINELEEIKKAKYIYRNDYTTKYYDSADEKDINQDDLIESKDYTLVFTQNGTVKKVPELAKFTKSLGNIENGDRIVSMIPSINSKDEVLIFTPKGTVFSSLVHQLPTKKSLLAYGDNISHMIKSEGMIKVINRKDLGNHKYLLIVSSMGRSKLIETSEIGKINKTGLIYSKLDKGDTIHSVIPVNEDDKVLVFYEFRTVNIIKISEFPILKRTTLGNKMAGAINSISLIPKEDSKVMIVTKSRYHKFVDIKEFNEGKLTGKGLAVGKPTQHDVSAIVVPNKFSSILVAVNSSKVDTFLIPYKETTKLQKRNSIGSVLDKAINDAIETEKVIQSMDLIHVIK